MRKNLFTLSISDIKFDTILDMAFNGPFEIELNDLHSHAYLEIYAIISGECCIEFMDGNICHMKAPQLCLIPVNVSHFSYPLTEGAKKLAIRFQYSRIEGESAMLPMFDDFDLAIRALDHHRCIPGGLVCELMLSIRNESICGSPTSEIYMNLLLQQLCLVLFRLMVPNPRNSLLSNTVEDGSNLRCYQIEDYFAKYYSQNITEDDLAQKLNLSKRQTSRILRGIFGMSFRDKLIEVRMRKAAKLLEITDIPIWQIAESVGYHSHSGFRIAFKKFYGISGEEYRRKIKSVHSQ